MIKLTSVKEASFDEMELPKTLYKYRKWNDEYHKKILTRREVYFARPTSFEDKYDCKIPIRYDLLTDRDIYNHYLFDSKKKNEDWSRQQHRDYARKWAKKSLIKNEKFVQNKQKIEFEEYDACIGILSLTADIYNIDMWANYSDNNKGFAVGFDPLIMFPFLGGGGPVIYYNVLPIIYPYPKHLYEEQIHLQKYSKLKKWEFEKEYRTQLFRPYPMNDSVRTIQIPPNAFKEIILGANMDENVIEDLIKSIPIELINVPIKQARMVNGNIEIH